MDRPCYFSGFESLFPAEKNQMKKSRIFNVLLFSLIAFPVLADNDSIELNIGRSEYNGQSNNKTGNLPVT